MLATLAKLPRRENFLKIDCTNFNTIRMPNIELPSKDWELFEMEMEVAKKYVLIKTKYACNSPLQQFAI